MAGRKPKIPRVREESGTEHHKAKFWRLHTVGITIDRLAELTGYSPRSIYLMELGCDAKGKKIKPWVWLRYKRACQGAAVERALNEHKQTFNWGQ
jgi:hypothetical protein